MIGIIKEETRDRIILAVYAYAYELQADPLVSDGEYDRLSKLIDTDIKTGNDKMDKFFKEEFSPDTGQWIHKHPELRKIAEIYETYFKGELNDRTIGNNNNTG